MQTLAQIVSIAPKEAGKWLRLSRTILQIRANDDKERTNFLERAATAAISPIRRSGMPAKRPTRWCCSDGHSRNASCGARRSTPIASRST